MATGPRNTKLTLAEGAMSVINNNIDSTSPSSHGGIGHTRGTENTTSSSSSSIGSSLLNFGSMFGKLVASRFGKLGQLFGLSTDEDVGYTNSENQDDFESSVTSSDYSSLSSSGTAVTANKANNFPYYNQGSNPWGPLPYTAIGDSSQTIKSSGCGPTSMAMILRSYGANYDPSTAATHSLNNGFRTAHDGTSWGFFKSIGNQEGLDVTQFKDSNIALSYLDKKIPVIATMGPGDFTKSGHFVVLAGKKNDQLMINDPASTDRTGKLWPYEKLSQATQFWAITKDGKGSIGNAFPGSTTDNKGYGGMPSDVQSKLFGNSSNSNTGYGGMPSDVQSKAFGSGSGIGNYNVITDSMNHANMRHRTARSAFGGGSGLVNMSRMSATRKARYMAEMARNLRASGSGAGANQEAMIGLVKGVVSLLTNVSANSEYMRTISEQLTTMSANNMNQSMESPMTLNNARDAIGAADTDATIREMKNLLDVLASTGDYAFV